MKYDKWNRQGPKVCDDISDYQRSQLFYKSEWIIGKKWNYKKNQAKAQRLFKIGSGIEDIKKQNISAWLKSWIYKNRLALV